MPSHTSRISDAAARSAMDLEIADTLQALLAALWTDVSPLM
ncbi:MULTISPECIES: hypothetical protein [unclassified Pseudomonas]|nr:MULTISPECIES: hypothetical protein [unclassified Pseudomonas]